VSEKVTGHTYLNLAKLAARRAKYLPNFHGPMSDAINRAEDSTGIAELAPPRPRRRNRRPRRGCGRHRRGRDRGGALAALTFAEDGSPLPGSTLLGRCDGEHLPDLGGAGVGRAQPGRDADREPASAGSGLQVQRPELIDADHPPIGGRVIV
jgi:hypothetical protein